MFEKIESIGIHRDSEDKLIELAIFLTIDRLYYQCTQNICYQHLNNFNHV